MTSSLVAMPASWAASCARFGGAAEDQNAVESSWPLSCASNLPRTVRGCPSSASARTASPGLGSEAKRHIAEAEFVFGGKRHLALAADLIKGEAASWPSPFDAAMRDLMALRGRRVCVLASGDPFLHGVGATLARHVPADEMHGLPGAVRLQPGGRPARLAAGRTSRRSRCTASRSTCSARCCIPGAACSR